MKKIFHESSGTVPSSYTKLFNANVISVSAVLIATVAFAAAFTPPGGTHIHGQRLVFKLFVIFDALAFCYSIASAIILNFAFSFSETEDRILTEISMNALWLAVLSLLLTFGAAIHDLVVASKCLWLAVLVWVVVCLLPIWIRAMSLRGKLYLFIPPERYVHILLGSLRADGSNHCALSHCLASYCGILLSYYSPFIMVGTEEAPWNQIKNLIRYVVKCFKLVVSSYIKIYFKCFPVVILLILGEDYNINVYK
ncbi:hypothetical protein SUGI_0425340 [Cryptomeria japonica]|nr:hypothetical protein SUGI_0425340 [Cryptomeria japonica]